MTYAMSASDMDPKWIEEMWAKFPCTKIVDQNGVENGNFRTGPVRLSFLSVFERNKPVPPATVGKFSATGLFPPAADLAVLKAAASAAALPKWPTAGQVGGPTLHTPFRQQADKANLEGYTPGGIFITAVADQRQPYVVDTRNVPITNKDEAQSGFWGFLVLRPFSFDAGLKKGVSFGLQGVMVIAKDRTFGGGGSSPMADFAGVSIDTSAQAAAINPAGLF
jgi:hypothetical protein